MIVISDTGPLRYLSVLGCIDLLPKLFGRVICPGIIIQECMHPRAPAEIRALVSVMPEWLIVQEPKQMEEALSRHLDASEAAAISLAGELQANLILMDEKKGRQHGKARGFAVAGTLNILALASKADCSIIRPRWPGCVRPRISASRMPWSRQPTMSMSETRYAAPILA